MTATSSPINSRKFATVVIFLFLLLGILGLSWSGIVCYYNVKASWNNLIDVIHLPSNSNTADKLKEQFENPNVVNRENESKANLQSKSPEIEIPEFYKKIGVGIAYRLDLSAVSPLLLIYFFGSILVGSCLVLTQHADWIQKINLLQKWLTQNRFPFVPSYQFYLMQFGLLGTIIGMTEGYATLAHTEDSQSMIVSLGAAFYSTLTAIVVAYVFGPPTGIIMRWTISNRSDSGNIPIYNTETRDYIIKNLDLLLKFDKIDIIEQNQKKIQTALTSLEERFNEVNVIFGEVTRKLSSLSNITDTIAKQQATMKIELGAEVSNRITSQEDQNQKIGALRQGEDNIIYQLNALQLTVDKQYEIINKVLKSEEYLRLGDTILKISEREKIESQIAQLRSNQENLTLTLNNEQNKLRKLMLTQVENLRSEVYILYTPPKTTPDQNSE
ncbi:MAG: MotA/TolQ/ExbB proton channel family protein [Magnetococcales bacterium]|nr:MotA/TolQ/ExbB proton channel family protein [Magnetococcales bacterium]